MASKDETKKQLLIKLEKLHQRISELEISEAQRKKTKDLLNSLIDESKKAYEKMSVSETRYRRLFETAQDGILLLDADTGQITDVNPFLMKILGYSHDELSNKKLWEVGFFKDIASSKAAFLKLQEHGYVRYEDLPLQTKEGRKIEVEFICNVYLVNGKKVIQCDIRDITDRKRMEEKVKNLITKDILTGVYNRRKFKEIIRIELERVNRYNTSLSIIMYDIDHFKKINDRHGHSRGDYVLKAVAAVARRNIRKIDYLFRWGGDEFLILSSQTQLNDANNLAERTRKAIAGNKFRNIGKVTASFGVTQFKKKDTIDRFIKRADDAMYVAKKKGKNRVELKI